MSKLRSVSFEIPDDQIEKAYKSKSNIKIECQVRHSRIDLIAEVNGKKLKLKAYYDQQAKQD